MAFGVDTFNALNTIDWAALYNWKHQYPQFACRYFGGGSSWTEPEFTDAKASTGGQLRFIGPIRRSQVDPQETDGPVGNGYGYGITDGNDTCNRIVNAVNAGQLSIPTYGVLVFLDVEPGTAITPAYWAGFADSVDRYKVGTGAPFFPAVYCSCTDQSGKYLPSPMVQDALGSAAHYWPSESVSCFGYWASEPEHCSYCAPDTVPDFSVFGTYEQPVGSGQVNAVPVKLYQYAQRGGCTTYPCNYPASWTGGQNLDMDGSGTIGTEAQMLVIA
jgi:hypothetical protein